MQVLVNDNHDINTLIHDNINVSLSFEVFQEYSDVFKGIGCLEGSYGIEIDPTVKAVINTPLRVQVTLKDPLKIELERMVKEGIVTPVSDTTDWMSSKVTVVKPSKLRIGINPKNLNRAIKRSHYPVPIIEEVATTLSNAKAFSVLGAKSGFLQMMLDEESSMLNTFNKCFWSALRSPNAFRYLFSQRTNFREE